jgi:hypothetical protein
MLLWFGSGCRPLEPNTLTWIFWNKSVNDAHRVELWTCILYFTYSQISMNHSSLPFPLGSDSILSILCIHCMIVLFLCRECELTFWQFMKMLGSEICCLMSIAQRRAFSKLLAQLMTCMSGLCMVLRIWGIQMQSLLTFSWKLPSESFPLPNYSH